MEWDFSKPYVGFGRERRVESLDVKKGVYYGNSVALLSFQLSCKYHERLRWPAAMKGYMTMFLSSLPLAMATMRVETGNGKLRRSRELWWGLEMHCPIYLQSACEKTHKHCFRAKRNGTPINVGHPIQGLIN